MFQVLHFEYGGPLIKALADAAKSGLESTVINFTKFVETVDGNNNTISNSETVSMMSKHSTMGDIYLGTGSSQKLVNL